MFVLAEVENAYEIHRVPYIRGRKAIYLTASSLRVCVQLLYLSEDLPLGSEP